MIKLLFAASISSFIFGFFGVSWDSVDKKIGSEFPSVQFISTDDLLKMRLAEQSMHLFDVRDADEFAVSRLQGATNRSKSQEIADLVLDKKAPIVVYCSVGYRSAAIASELESMGYSNVLNVRHSIFEWAEKGYPMVSGSGDADTVHPFNRAWGSLIDTSLHEYPQ